MKGVDEADGIDIGGEEGEGEWDLKRKFQMPYG
jgi:hypothetical protein